MMAIIPCPMLFQVFPGMKMRSRGEEIHILVRRTP
jgi:hypothetical protein